MKPWEVNFFLTYLIATPYETRQEEDHARNAENSANKINMLYDLHFTEAFRVDPRWRVIKEEGRSQCNASPYTTYQANVAPASVVGD